MVILFWGSISILTAPLVSALAVHVTRDLGLPASVLGVILTAYGVGTITGALVTAKFGRHRPAPILLGGSIVTGSMLVVLATGAPLPVFLAAALASGVAQSMVLLTYITLRTNMSPDELLGRIGSTARTISLGLQPIGLLVGGLIIDATSGSTTMTLMGIGMVLLSLAFATVGAMRRASATQLAVR